MTDITQDIYSHYEILQLEFTETLYKIRLTSIFAWIVGGPRYAISGNTDPKVSGFWKCFSK